MRRASRARKRTATASAGLTSGRVMLVKRLQAFAPSILAASYTSSGMTWRAWENRKASNRWYWAALAALCALGMAGGWFQYTSFRAEFEAQGLTWLALWGQSTLLPTMLFLPLLVAALTAQTAAGEHQGRNWQRMNANRLQGAMVAGKVLQMAQNSLLTALVLLGEFIVTGLLLGFDPAELGPQ